MKRINANENMNFAKYECKIFEIIGIFLIIKIVGEVHTNNKILSIFI